MNKQQIQNALSLLNDKLAEKKAVGELALFGGAVMVLVFCERDSTKDIDAMFHPSDIVRTCAQLVAHELGLPEDWLNDGVKGFIGKEPSLYCHPDLPQFDHLRLLIPTPEYLLAMKCLASRIGAGQTDYTDAKFLVQALGYQHPKQVLELLEAYYPPDIIPMRSKYFIEELFDEPSKTQ